MGKEFTSLKLSLGDDFNLSEGLSSGSSNVTSAQFYGPDGESTGVVSSLAALNTLSTSVTKYTIIDVAESNTGIVNTGIYNSGWYTEPGPGNNRLGQLTTYTFQHNLGTTDVTYNVYAARRSDGFGQVDISSPSGFDAASVGFIKSFEGRWLGSIVTITENEINVHLGHGAPWTITEPNRGFEPSWSAYSVITEALTHFVYLKVVVRANI